ncbi:MAG: 50S ribosomal protein L11 methyltransferase [Desulfobacterales bacterium]|uniref:50S ribosomal protein L11 methyltransferase n=1 Tax=Candidatus Desulfatibia vada TaxID=2841696 RepID=A0A8J6NRJ6_9BACT|nr:50S ribosomal protein L11 methyltransferase [Candidatus Desulfatibia vada]
MFFYRIGNLVVRSPLSIRRPKRGEDCLVLRTSRSFPPAHPSTKAALTVLQRLEVNNEVRILDIGCGSGILGLAAALKYGATALGCDISPASVKASMQNAAYNRMEDRLHLFRGSADAVKGSFQLILANLPAGIHAEMFDHYRRLTIPNESLLVISGFCDVMEAGIKEEIVNKGFIVMERVVVNAWAAATTPEYTYTWVGLGLKRIEK